MEAGYCDSAPPNPPCISTSPADGENMFARSRHQGGVNVALCDGSVRFVSDTIAINTWQALGTAEGSDIVGTY
jgi:prepilin-type processing-associated H-X9-DG protein